MYCGNKDAVLTRKNSVQESNLQPDSLHQAFEWFKWSSASKTSEEPEDIRFHRCDFDHNGWPYSGCPTSLEPRD